MATIDFLYSGESKILGENLKYFLAIAKEFQKKVLSDQNSEDLMNTQEKVVKLIPKKEETKCLALSKFCWRRRFIKGSSGSHH